MPINHDPLQKAFETIKDAEAPSEQQKDNQRYQQYVQNIQQREPQESE